MHERWRIGVLSWWAGLIYRRAWWVLALAASATAGSILLAYTRMEFHSDRNALLSQDLEWNRRFEDWRASFPGNEDFYVVVDAAPPPQAPSQASAEDPKHAEKAALAREFVSQLGPALQASDLVEQAVWSFEQNQFSPKTLRLEPMERFTKRLDEMRSAKAVLASPTIDRLFQTILGELGRRREAQLPEHEAVDQIDGLTRLVACIRQVIAKPASQRHSLGQLVEGQPAEEGGPVYLSTENGRLLFIRVTPRKVEGAINAFGPAIQEIRRLLGEHLSRFPGVEAGLTGVDVIEADETDAANRDSTIASVVAAVIITILLLLSYRSWRTPVLAMAALLTGIAWTFGFLTLAIGHLQILSVVFAVMLLGLGIAFGIHLASQIELVRSNYPDGGEGFRQALKESLCVVGPGVITGAVTTAAAFCTTVFTDFKGVAEMGLISGVGIMLCLLAMTSIYPALLTVFAADARHYLPAGKRAVPVFHGRWVRPFTRRPVVTLIVAGILTVVSVWAASGVGFDYDLLKLQPRGVDSVRWQQRVVRDGQQSIWVAVAVAPSLEEARRWKNQFSSLATVGQIDGIGLLSPDDEAQKIEQLDHLRTELSQALHAGSADTAAPNADQIAASLRQFNLAVKTGLWTAKTGDPVSAAIGAIWPFGRKTQEKEKDPTVLALESLGREIEETIAAIESLPAKQRRARVDELNQEYAHWHNHVRRQVTLAVDTSPITPGDLPAELLRPYVADRGPLNGMYALEIHPRLPADRPSIKQPLDPRFLPVFVDELTRTTVDGNQPYLTGVILQVFYSGDLIQKSYLEAGVYAFLVVFALVWLDFRSLHSALLSLVPVAVGFAMTFGLMRALRMSVNPANIIVLPLMFGIGVDSGVHMIHRHRQDPALRPLGLSRGTGQSITLTSLTTMIGFASMMVARHRGIANLGFVLCVGIGLTLLACWIVVPAWLELVNRWRGIEAKEETQGRLDSASGAGTNSEKFVRAANTVKTPPPHAPPEAGSPGSLWTRTDSL